MQLLTCLPLLLSPAQEPGDAQWIWGSWADGVERPGGEVCAFRRDFELAADVEKALLTITVDNAYVLFVNGTRVGRDSDWQKVQRYDVAEGLRPGSNRIEITARNQGGAAGLFAFLDVELEGGDTVRLESNATWTTRRRREGGPDAGAWEPAAEFGPYGMAPWGSVALRPTGAVSWGGSDVPIEERFEAPPGFRVEESWQSLASFVALEIIDGSRIFASTEKGGVVELIDGDGDGAFDEELPFTDAVTRCQGLAWRADEDALYCVGQGPEGAGLYRVRRTAAEQPEFLGGFDSGGGEHGPHAVVPGPDGALYVVLGNHVGLKGEWGSGSPYRTIYEGHLLPRLVDPRGHADDIDAPGGIVVRYDAESGAFDVIAAGLRNSYDLAFNANGDLFTFDSDMEWDLGLPWYREVRLLHVVPGGEYGWRTGSSKWPAWYPDSLPPACEVGRGSPTGIAHYDGDMFPARYRGAILAGDWSRGRVIAFHLEPDGVSYTARAEELLLGRPLSVSDLAVAPDGSVLISAGGRGTEGWIYRLVYDGDPGVAAGPTFPEALPAWPADAGVDELLGALGSEDRFVRFAAGRAIERSGATVETLAPELMRIAPAAAAEALVVAARGCVVGDDPAGSERGLELAGALVEGGVEGDTLLAALRAIDLFLQAGDVAAAKSEAEAAAAAAAAGGAEAEGEAEAQNEANNQGRTRADREREIPANLGPALLARFPTGDRDADHQLALLLGYLAPPGTPEALLAAMRDEPSRAGQLHYAYALRVVDDGWTDATREALAGWTALARSWGGGYSFPGYVRRVSRDVEELFGEEYAQLFEDEAEPGPSWTPPPAYGGAPWGYDATLAFLRGGLEADRRSAAEGARVFAETCARCHPMGAFQSDSGGGSLGPDLEGVTRRFPRADLLESIVEPSRVIPAAYRARDVFLVGGAVESGLVIEEGPDGLLLARSDGSTVSIAADEVDEARESSLSTMPAGLLHGLTLEQVADLFHFLDTGKPQRAPERSEWKSLFDGKTLDNWVYDEALWTVEDGVIHGAGKDLPTSSFLISAESYADFVIEFDIRVDTGNSGLQFRSERFDGFRLRGYQADVGDVYWGSLYEEGGRGMLNRTPDTVWVPAVDEEGWNHYAVEAVGDRLRIEVNGAVTTDLRDGRTAEGLFGFQLHAGTTRIELRNLRVLVR